MIAIDRLLALMAALRDPETGCPWDRKQTFESLIPYTLEEAYEVVDAIERSAWDELSEELGDLLLQVVFYAQIAKEAGWFDFDRVVERLCAKLLRRHPHVFGGTSLATEAEVKQTWEEIKRSERRRKGEDGSVLAGIPAALPALLQAEEIQTRAARCGFDWPEVMPVFAKVEEELAELREACASGEFSHIQEEIGDLLFAVVNLARHLKVHPETALRESNRKFIRRFRYLEERLKEQGKNLADTPLASLDALWDEAKRSDQA